MNDSPTHPPGPDDKACDAYLTTLERDGEWQASLDYLASYIVIPPRSVGADIIHCDPAIHYPIRNPN